MQNEGMQRQIIKLEAKVKKRKKHGDNNESANSQDLIGSGSYDNEQDRSFNDNSTMQQNPGQSESNRVLIESLE